MNCVKRFALGVLCMGTVGMVGQELVPLSAFVLRSAPVGLENPDRRDVSNAVLQAFAPVLADVLNLHAERTGVFLDDGQWLAFMTMMGSCTSAQLRAAALARSVLAINSFLPDSVCTSYPFQRAVNGASYGHDAHSLPYLVQDVVRGLNDLTAVRIAHHCLPVDRELASSFDAASFLSQRILESNFPDVCVVDSAGVQIRTLDKCSPCGGSLSGTAELSLPGELIVSDAQGNMIRYELCSFISLERPGLDHTSGFGSKMASLCEEGWCRTPLMEVATHIASVRHMTATVRYGDSWFVADDVAVWSVERPAACSPVLLGAALLRHQPGRRAVVIYRKGSVGADAFDLSATDGIDLHLTKTTDFEGSALAQQARHALVESAKYIVHGAAGMALITLAHNSFTRTYTSHLLRYLFGFAVVGPVVQQAVLTPCGRVVHALREYLLIKRRRQMNGIHIAAGEPHRSSLY